MSVFFTFDKLHSICNHALAKNDADFSPIASCSNQIKTLADYLESNSAQAQENKIYATQLRVFCALTRDVLFNSTMGLIDINSEDIYQPTRCKKGPFKNVESPFNHHVCKTISDLFTKVVQSLEDLERVQKGALTEDNIKIDAIDQHTATANRLIYLTDHEVSQMHVCTNVGKYSNQQHTTSVLQDLHKEAINEKVASISKTEMAKIQKELLETAAHLAFAREFSEQLKFQEGIGYQADANSKRLGSVALAHAINATREQAKAQENKKRPIEDGEETEAAAPPAKKARLEQKQESPKSE